MQRASLHRTRRRRAGTPRPPAFLRGIEARSVADEQLAVEGAHVGEAEMLRCEALALSKRLKHASRLAGRGRP